MGDSTRDLPVTHAELHAAILGCARAAQVAEPAAEALADHIVEAHLRGVDTHGLRRLRPYLDRVAIGGVEARAAPVIDEHGAVLRVDGRNGIGHHVARVAADAAIAKARETGISVALVRNSNHFGFAGYYASRIAAASMVGLVTSNGQVMVGPDGALRPIFSNDPLAISAPYAGGGMFELDLALSVTSRQNIVRAARLGQAIAPGMALDSDGVETTDADAALAGLLLAFGGARGFALLTAVEVLTGVLTGGAFADLVGSKESAPDQPEATAHFMLAIDLDHALGAELFNARLLDLAERLQDLPMRDGAPQPRMPGTRRWRLRAERLAQAIPLAAQDFDDLLDLCRGYGVPVPAGWTRDTGGA